MRSLLAGSVLLGLCACAVSSQSPTSQKQVPVQAEFTKPVHGRNLSVGAVVLAHVTENWTGHDCELRSGSILEAKVVVAGSHKGHGESKLALAFTRAQCSGPDLKPMNLVLAALAAPSDNSQNSPNFDTLIRVDFRSPASSAPFGFFDPGAFKLSHMDLQAPVRTFPMNHPVFPGDVLNIKGLKLDPGTGPNGSSVLSARNRDVTLPIFTQLLLVPAIPAGVSRSVLQLEASLSAGAEAVRPPPRAAPDPPAANDLSVCAPPGCAVDLPVPTQELEGESAASIATRALGYPPRPRRVVEQFGDEECLAWLGRKELLFAFNPHPLIDRTSESSAGSIHRVVRAVLLNAVDHTVERVMEWQIADARRYLWPLDRDRVLVHVGNELRVYGQGLEVEHIMPLAGPLSFVRIAPNGELMAIATLRERHSPELHEELRESLGYDPEEDVDIEILDQGFHTIAQTSTVSNLRPPTLLNEGQVSLAVMPHQRYLLTLNSWDNKHTTLAKFASGCSPELSAADPDLLFLLTCDPFTNATEYRVLRSDGKPMLRGQARPEEVGHQLKGTDQSQKVAFKIVHAYHELSSDFSETDLEWEEVRVYDAADGKRLFAVRVDAPIAANDSYALSPDGSQLAVLSQSQIQFFSVPNE